MFESSLCSNPSQHPGTRRGPRPGSALLPQCPHVALPSSPLCRSRHSGVSAQASARFLCLVEGGRQPWSKAGNREAGLLPGGGAGGFRPALSPALQGLPSWWRGRPAPFRPLWRPLHPAPWPFRCLFRGLGNTTLSSDPFPCHFSCSELSPSCFLPHVLLLLPDEPMSIW